MITRSSLLAKKRNLRSVATKPAGKRKCTKSGRSGRKAKQFSTQNLPRFKTKSRATQTDHVVAQTGHVVAHLETRHFSTQTTPGLEPFAGTYTTADNNKEKCLSAQDRLDKCMRRGFHWTPEMLVVMLRFLYYLVASLNWSWTQACYKASQVFKLHKDNVFVLAKAHRDSTLD